MKNISIERTENGTLATATINAICAELLKTYTSNTKMKEAKNEICEFYSLSEKDWKEIASETKRLRSEQVKADLTAAKTSAFDFGKWLSSGFDLLRKDAAFCRVFARWQSTKLKGEDLDSFVSSWYPFVEWNADRTSFELLKPASLYRLEETGIEYRAQIFVAWEKTAADAAKVLLKSFENWAKSYTAFAVGKTLTFINSRERGKVYRVESWDVESIKWVQRPELCDTFTADLETLQPAKYFKDSGIVLPHLLKDVQQVNE